MYGVNLKILITRLSGSGFTLVEVLVAISIMTLIGTLVIPNFNRFNDNQQAQNFTNDLIRNLRQAQSSASSNIGCHISSISASQNWQVKVSNNSFTLHVNCTDGTSIDMYNPPPLSGLTLGVRVNNGSCTPDTITFLTGFQPYQLTRSSNILYFCGAVENVSATNLEIKLTKNNSAWFVCVSKGGAMYVSAAVCF